MGKPPGRHPKKGVDYSGWSVTIFDNDTKIDKLLDAQGWNGFGIYFYLCQRAYGGEGYFYQWCYDDCASTARKMGGGIRAGTVKETVSYCLRIGLFDKGLFDRYGVLTSRGIQSRYWEVLRTRDVRNVIADYWLLPDDECKGLKKTPLESSLNGECTDFRAGNTNFDVGNVNFHVGNTGFPAQKESKGKKSKKDKNTLCKTAGFAPPERDVQALFDNLWKLYPVKRGKARVLYSQKVKLFQIGYEEMERAIHRYKKYVASVDYLHFQNGSTFFNSGYVDYLDTNYDPAVNSGKTYSQKKDSFNDYPHREYDFDEIRRTMFDQ